MAKEEVLKNLNSLKGQEYDIDKIIEAFKGYEECGKVEVAIEENEYLGAFAHINVERPTIFWIPVEDGKIVDDSIVNTEMYSYYDFYCKMLRNYYKFDIDEIFPDYFINDYFEKEEYFMLVKLVQRCSTISEDMLLKIYDKLEKAYFKHDDIRITRFEEFMSDVKVILNHKNVTTEIIDKIAHIFAIKDDFFGEKIRPVLCGDDVYGEFNGSNFSLYKKDFYDILINHSKSSKNALSELLNSDIDIEFKEAINNLL